MDISSNSATVSGGGGGGLLLLAPMLAIGASVSIALLAAKRRRNNHSSSEATSDCLMKRDASDRNVSKLEEAASNDDLAAARQDFLKKLECANGDAKSPDVLSSLEVLSSLYRTHLQGDARNVEMDGKWKMESEPSFPGNLGTNILTGDRLFSLGRMSFNMFRPSNLVLSVQSISNPITPVKFLDLSDIPLPRGKIQDRIRDDPSKLRKYGIRIEFTIEGDQKEDGTAEAATESTEDSSNMPLAPLRGIMETEAYIYPDPDTPSRMSVFFTGGKMWPRVSEGKDDSKARWRAIFGADDMPPRPIKEKMMLGFAKLLMGAQAAEGVNPDDVVEYSMKRPVLAYLDVLYLDDTLRVTRGCRGSVVVVTRGCSEKK